MSAEMQISTRNIAICKSYCFKLFMFMRLKARGGELIADVNRVTKQLQLHNDNFNCR